MTLYKFSLSLSGIWLSQCLIVWANCLVCSQVRLIDFNPIGGTTSPLLFDWAELNYSLPTQHAFSSEHNEPSASNGHSATEGTPNGRCSPLTEAVSPSSGPQDEPSDCVTGSSQSLAGSLAGVSSQGGRHVHTGAAGELESVEGVQQGEILFRLNTDGAVMRPSLAAYGAPYDMVDTSDGSAISDLLSRLHTEEVG